MFQRFPQDRQVLYWRGFKHDKAILSSNFWAFSSTILPKPFEHLGLLECDSRVLTNREGQLYSHLQGAIRNTATGKGKVILPTSLQNLTHTHIRSKNLPTIMFLSALDVKSKLITCRMFHLLIYKYKCGFCLCLHLDVILTTAPTYSKAAVGVQVGLLPWVTHLLWRCLNSTS